MSRKTISTFALLALMLLTVLMPDAKADTLFEFTRDNCTGTCGGGANYTYGTVQLTQLTPLAVRVLVTLGPNSRFAGTGAGEALTFSIFGTKSVTIDQISSNFAAGPTNVRHGSLGTFEYSVECVPCSGGSASNPTGPLSFRVSSTSGLVMSDFIASTRGYYFSSDIVGINGNTGNVAALGGHYVQGYDVATPEPATLCMTGAAAVLLAVLSRRIKRAEKV